MRRFVLAVVLATAVVISLVPAGPAGAAISPPTLVAPANGTSVTANPVFQWNPVAGAVSYSVLVDDAADFVSPLLAISTTNTSLTPTQELGSSSGTLYWRVTAYEAGSGTGANSPVWTYTRSVPGPNILGPANGANIVHPAAPTFSWDPVAGAEWYWLFVTDGFVTYPIQISTDQTSYTPTAILPFNRTLHWTVSAVMSEGGGSTGWAPSRSFTVTMPAPVAISPGVVYGSGQPQPTVEQVEYVWNPVPGAVAYEVIESGGTPVRVEGTSYTPAKTLNNSGHNWQVRAVAADGQRGALSALRVFTRAWPDATSPATDFMWPVPISPVAGARITEPVFTWSPSRLASRYALEFSEDPNFTSYETVYTNHTSYTPAPGSWSPPIGRVYFWRVKGLDANTGAEINGRYAEFGRSFVYYPELIQLTGPASGNPYHGPKLTWNPSSATNIARFRVQIHDADGTKVKDVLTYNSSYIPSGLSTAPVDNPHTWQVAPVTDAGEYLVDGYDPSTQIRSFTAVGPTATFATPTSTTTPGASGPRVPALTWQPTNATDTYTVKYRLGTSGAWSTLASGLTVPGYAHTTDSVAPGTYQWYVEAYTSGGALRSSGSPATFTVNAVGSTTLVSPAHCAVPASCTKVNDTPTFDWNAVAGATGYNLVVAADPAFTNVVLTKRTAHTQYTQLDSLTNGTYHWYAQPCWGSVCGAPAGPANSRTFVKGTKALPLLSPANGSTVTSDKVRFQWTGFLQSNQTGLEAERVTQEARSYRVEVSTSSTFALAGRVELTGTLDATTYTTTDAEYPEGVLYWRVIVIDGSNHEIGATPGWSFTKQTPAATPGSPANGVTLTSMPSLSWATVPFTEHYEIEVYRADGAVLSGSNRVVSRSTRNTAITPVTGPFDANYAKGSLPPGQYGWRVRAIDAENEASPWSGGTTSTSLRLFTITPPVPALSVPEAGATSVIRATLRFQWGSIPTATKYRIEVNTNATFTGTVVANVVTVMPTWAPTSTIPAGTYHWRVTSLAPDGTVQATSPSRQFTG